MRLGDLTPRISYLFFNEHLPSRLLVGGDV
jgi:hypothetical protein